MAIAIDNFLKIIAAAAAYYIWSLLQESNETIRKIVFLILLVGLLVLTLTWNSLDLLRSRVDEIEGVVLPKQTKRAREAVESSPIKENKNQERRVRTRGYNPEEDSS